MKRRPIDEGQWTEARRRRRVARSLLRGRWVALALLICFGAVAGGLLVADGKLEAVLDHVQLPAMIFTAYVLANGAISLAFDRVTARIDLHLPMLVVDLLAITAVVHDSGGAASWLWPMYCVLTLEAAIVFESAARTWAVAAAGAGLFGVMLYLENIGWLPPRPMPFVEVALHTSGEYALLLWVWVASLCSGVALIGGQLTAQIRSQRDRLRYLAERDAVTGLFARPYFERRLATESVRAARGERLFSVILLEIPGYEELLGTDGYQLTDAVLRRTAAQVEAAIPAPLVDLGAVTAYFGSGRFALLLPETDANVGAEAAEQIRASVQTAEAQVQAERVRERALAMGGDLVAGIATYGEHGVSPEELLRAARQAAASAASAGGDAAVQIAQHHAAKIRWQDKGGAA